MKTDKDFFLEKTILKPIKNVPQKAVYQIVF